MELARRGPPLRLNLISSAVVALLVALMALAPAVAAADEGVVLAADENRPLILGDIAFAEELGGFTRVLGVVWQNRGLSYIRASTSGSGEDTLFGPAEALRGGLRATDPRVAACGDHLYAASVWRTGAGDKIGIDYSVPLGGPEFSGRYVLGFGTRPDIACMGALVAVTYMSGELARIAIFHGSDCSNPCVPMFQFNLGAMPEFGRATVAGTDRGFVVSWMGPGIWVQRFVVTDTGVTAHPATTVGTDSWYPQIDADGRRVVIAYQRRGQTHMRISEDRGRTFGPRIVVSTFCLECPEGSSSAESVAVRDGRVMVHVVRGGGIPPALEQQRFLTENDGQSWTRTPTGQGGSAFGVLMDWGLAEAWDNHVYAGDIYGNQAQEIRFRTQNLP